MSKNMFVRGDLLLVHQDKRRVIREYDSPTAGFSVQAFSIQDSIPLGNHYHIEKDEIFVLVSGAGRLIVQVMYKGDPPSVAIPKENPETFELLKGAVVKIPSFVAHAFVLEPGSEMLCFSSKPFDAKDMYSHVLVVR